MKILGFEVKRAAKTLPVPVEHSHTAGDCVSLSAGIYKCESCGKACIYVNQKLVELTTSNTSDNDKGKTINGIFQF